MRCYNIAAIMWILECLKISTIHVKVCNKYMHKMCCVHTFKRYVTDTCTKNVLCIYLEGVVHAQNVLIVYVFFYILPAYQRD